jgi:4-hydroxythreonine-4-phosphate dehydrogenase
MENENISANLPKIGITLGDFNGIGPEVVIKTLQDNRMNRLCVPVIYGSSRILARYKKILNIEQFQYQQIGDDYRFSDRRINVVNCWEDNYEVTPGKPLPEAGKCAALALAKSTADLQAGLIQAVVTAPINKFNIQGDDFPYPGHTEYYADQFGKGPGSSLMLLVSEKMRVGTVTGHLPLVQVPGTLTRELLAQKLDLLLQSLREDFAIKKPRVAVLGLNPHAGEDGLLGDEELAIISPVIQQYRDKGHLVLGPYPADGFFGAHTYQKFDAVLAMYHDQGLIPFKMLGFESGVNFTAGLSVVRTSPDHGTAYDLAGTGTADESSFRSALFLALDIIRNRALHAERRPKREGKGVMVDLKPLEGEQELSKLG